MPDIRWAKSPDKNRIGTCNGGTRRKCQRTDGKDAVKGKEGECTKKRGFLRSLYAKRSIADGILIKIKSSPCDVEGKPNPDSSKKIDVCENSLDGSLININGDSKSLQGVGVWERGVDTECNENCDDRHLKCEDCLDVKKGMWDNEDKEDLKSIWDNGYKEDVKQGIRDNGCMEDLKQGMQDNQNVKQGILDMELGIPNGGCMLHVGLDATSVKKEKISDEGIYVKCTDSSLDSHGMNCGSCKECDTEVEDKDTLHEKSLGTDSESVMVPHDFVCGISKKVMEDPVVIASGLTFERAYIQAWLDEGNTLCPVTHELLSHFELIPNLNLKALISSWYSHLQESGLQSTDHCFSSCVSSFSSCSDALTSHPQSFVSCSSFSVSKLLEETELYSSSDSSSSSSHPTKLHSFSSSSISLPSYDTPEHLRAVGIHNFPYSPSSTGSSSSFWKQEREEFTQQENTLESVCKRQGENKTAMSKPLQSCNLHSKFTSQSAEPCSYIVLRIDSLVADLQSKYKDMQRSAAAELRLLAKHDDGNRLMIASAGALRPLVALIWSRDQSVQLEATTALLNLSLNHSLRDNIVKEGAIEALVWVLRDEFSTVTKENAAATLAGLASSEEYKIRIGSAGAVKPLVNLLERGSLRGRKDAAAALYRLSSNDENKRRIVRAGASRPLVGFMCTEGDKDGMVDKAMAILGNLVSIEEGRVSFVEEKGILSLMQVLWTGSERSKGLGISILSQLCVHSSKHRSLVLQKEPLPALMVLSKTGNTRLKMQIAKVIQLLIIDAD